jgi:hypothetical protein
MHSVLALSSAEVSIGTGSFQERIEDALDRLKFGENATPSIQLMNIPYRFWEISTAHAGSNVG